MNRPLCKRWVLAAVLGTTALAACGGGEQQRLTITGSSTVAPLVNEIARRFEAQNPGYRIDVQTGGSTRGVRDARRGLADIGMASRALTADESDLLAHTIARDGIAVIVNADNPVDRLSPEQVRAIYRGEASNWARVGGEDRAITVVHKADGRSTQALFLAHFGLGAAEVRPGIVIGDNQQGLRSVSGDPAAIGYVSIGAAETARDRGDALRLLPLEGVEASTAAIRAGRYPLSRPMNLITDGPPGPAAAAFIAYAQSAAVHDLVRDLHFVPLDGND